MIEDELECVALILQFLVGSLLAPHVHQQACEPAEQFNMLAEEGRRRRIGVESHTAQAGGTVHQGQGQRAFQVHGLQQLPQSAFRHGRDIGSADDVALAVGLHPVRIVAQRHVLKQGLVGQDARCTPLVGVAAGLPLEVVSHEVSAIGSHVAGHVAQCPLNGAIQTLCVHFNERRRQIQQQMLELAMVCGLWHRVLRRVQGVHKCTSFMGTG